MSDHAEASNPTPPEQWAEVYGDYLFNYAISRLNDKHLALDMVQETFLAALAARERFEGRSSEKTWLISILKRKIIDHYRKNYRNREDTILDKNYHEGKEELPFYADGEMAGHWKADRVPQDWQISAEKALENEELRKIIEACVGALPEKWSAVFVLRVIEEINTDEVCKELNISSSNLWVIIHRAKLQLRDCIEKNWLK